MIGPDLHRTAVVHRRIAAIAGGLGDTAGVVMAQERHRGRDLWRHRDPIMEPDERLKQMPGVGGTRRWRVAR